MHIAQNPRLEQLTVIISKTHWKFVTVPGSRRIWGTMKNTTCAAIQNDGTITKWWLVVHGEESLLADLDNQWDTITIKLGWKLKVLHLNGLSGELDFIHILYFNAHSLLPNIEEFCALCATNSPDIVCVVETWADNSILDCELNIPNMIEVGMMGVYLSYFSMWWCHPH